MQNRGFMVTLGVTTATVFFILCSLGYCISNVSVLKEKVSWCEGELLDIDKEKSILYFETIKGE